MPEPDDLKDKLQDSREIAFELLHDLSANPVTNSEETCLALVSEILGLLTSGIDKARRVIEHWPEEP